MLLLSVLSLVSYEVGGGDCVSDGVPEQLGASEGSLKQKKAGYKVIK